MGHVLKLENCGPAFSSFKTMPGKITKEISWVMVSLTQRIQMAKARHGRQD